MNFASSTAHAQDAQDVKDEQHMNLSQVGIHPGVEDLIRELRQCQEEGDPEVARLRIYRVWQHQMLSTSADAEIFRKCTWIQLDRSQLFSFAEALHAE